MSVLFFDGFDRCTLTKDWDPNYWSFEPQQPVEYKKYAFGGYSYDHTVADYGYGDSNYWYYSPNNATLPTGVYVRHAVDTHWGSYISGNPFPGFGTPPGFLALHNLDISDANLLAPTTYVQLSGFAQPSGQTSFLTTRILGIETKDANYHSSDKPGRFGSKHPLIAFCSGNTTGLILNIIKTTGNHLDVIENQKMTMGLEVEQLNGISGIFDLNITNDLLNYQIRSVYDNSIQNYTISDVSGRILTVDTDTTSNWTSPISRWCHFQFGIINTGDVPYIQVKLEDIDLLSIPTDDTVTDKDLWEDRIYISGFNYDNIRFFNRTYNNSFQFNFEYYYGSNVSDYNKLISRYYMKGAVTLIDDVILSDDAGAPGTFLGKNAKVVPFSPGINANVNNNGVADDGLVQWNSNTSSYRTALKNADGDDGKITASVSGLITAVAYRPMIPQIQFDSDYSDDFYKTGSDNASVNVWGTVEDAVGGLKVYTQGKKEFLDTSYRMILRTGVADPLATGNKAVFNFDNDSVQITDLTSNRFVFTKSDVNIQLSTDVVKNGTKSLRLLSGEYIQNNDLATLYNFDLNKRNAGFYGSQDILSPPTRTDFTIEAWVKFTGLNDQLVIYSKDWRNSNIQNTQSVHGFELIATTGYIQYNVVDGSAALSSIYYSGYLNLYFDSLINDNDWHHISLVHSQNSLIAYLDGTSGTSYHYWQSGALYDLQYPFFNNLSSPGSGTNQSLYYWSNSTIDNIKAFTAFKIFYSDYSAQYRIPTRIYGNGYIDDYRITFNARYSGNFVPPNNLNVVQDDYIQVGDVQNLTKTRYAKIVQMYEYTNPINNEPWTTGLINHPSGLIFGVQKI